MEGTWARPGGFGDGRWYAAGVSLASRGMPRCDGTDRGVPPRGGGRGAGGGRGGGPRPGGPPPAPPVPEANGGLTARRTITAGGHWAWPLADGAGAAGELEKSPLVPNN